MGCWSVSAGPVPASRDAVRGAGRCQLRRHISALAACWMVCGQAGVARAHAGPQLHTILTGDGVPGSVAIGNRGFIFGDDASSSWRLMCNEAIGVTTSEVPDVVRLADGRMLAATSHGLLMTADGGCSWQGVEPFGSASTISLTRHPVLADALYLTVYGAAVSGLYTSEDAGLHWTSLLMAADTDNLDDLLIAPSEPERMYMRKLGLSGTALVYAVAHSSDAGKTWQDESITLGADETDLLLLGVSPTDPELLVAKAEGANPSAVAERLLISRDGGRSFEDATQLRAISAVAWSEDGATLWLGSDEGLFRSSDAGRQFERVGTADLVNCLRRSAGELLLCGYYLGSAAGMPGVGASRDGGETMRKWMGLTDVSQPIACDASSSTAIACSAWWADWQREILSGAPTAANGGSSSAPPTAADAGAAIEAGRGDRADGATAQRSTTSGCQVSDRRDPAIGWPAAALFGFLGSRLGRLRRDGRSRRPHRRTGFREAAGSR